MRSIRNFHLIITLTLFTYMTVHAQEAEQPVHPKEAQQSVDIETLKKANDPMADVKALNFQNYIVSKITGTDMQQNQMLVRYAQPVGKFLFRATMPLVTVYQPETAAKSGLGDLNVFAIYSLPSSAGNKFGIGPSITMPTATSDLTGAGKWQAGISALAFFAKNHQIQWGSLLQWQTSFAGDEDRNNISMLTAQCFFIWQIGGGFCIRSTGVWSFNLEDTGNYNVPIGLGLGKVIRVNKTVFNIFAEPQFTVLAEGYGQQQFQTFVGFNLQF